jgi:hypothetical protein
VLEVRFTAQVGAQAARQVGPDLAVRRHRAARRHRIDETRCSGSSARLGTQSSWFAPTAARSIRLLLEDVIA